MFNKHIKTVLKSIIVAIHDMGDKIMRSNDDDDQVFLPISSSSITTVRSECSLSVNNLKCASAVSSSISESARNDSAEPEVINSNGCNKDIGSTDLPDVQILALSTHI